MGNDLTVIPVWCHMEQSPRNPRIVLYRTISLTENRAEDSKEMKWYKLACSLDLIQELFTESQLSVVRRCKSTKRWSGAPRRDIAEVASAFGAVPKPPRRFVWDSRQQHC